MIDILRILFPNASADYLFSASLFFVVFGAFGIYLGVTGLILESIAQKRLFYEAFPGILFGLFCIIPLGMHSNISFPDFLKCFQLLISIP